MALKFSDYFNASVGISVGAIVTANANAVVNDLTPVDVSAGPLTIVAPADPKKDDTFGVVDNTGNAAANHITVDFSTDNFQGATGTYIATRDNQVIIFRYIDAVTGWVIDNDNSSALENDYVGATSTESGSGGEVPPADPSERGKVLRGDGTWTNTVPMWNLGLNYTAGEVVIKDHQIYYANGTIVQNTAFVAGPGIAEWTLLSDTDFPHRGEWDLTNAYELGDLVIKEGTHYRPNTAIAANTAFLIGTGPNTWTALYRNPFRGNWDSSTLALPSSGVHEGDSYRVTNGPSVITGATYRTGELIIANVDTPSGGDWSVIKTDIEPLLAYCRAIGPLTSGLTLKPAAVSMQVKTLSGSVTLLNANEELDVHAYAGDEPENFAVTDQLGTDLGSVTTLDFDSYDNAGTVTALATGTTSIHYVFFDYALKSYVLQLGQKEYSTWDDAIIGIRDDFIIAPTITSHVLIAIIVAKEGASDLGDVSQVSILHASMHGEVDPAGGSGTGRGKYRGAWALTDAYVTGELVINTGDFFTANSDIASNVAWKEGTLANEWTRVTPPNINGFGVVWNTATTTFTVSDPRIKLTSIATIVQLDELYSGDWEVNTAAGSFTITSTVSEEMSPTFDWFLEQ